MQGKDFNHLQTIGLYIRTSSIDERKRLFKELLRRYCFICGWGRQQCICVADSLNLQEIPE